MNKTAKEMFEELGYEQFGTYKPDDDYIIIAYTKQIYDDTQYIYFYGKKEIRIVLEDKKSRVYPPIFQLEELQAINKQIEELGWNNE